MPSHSLMLPVQSQQSLSRHTPPVWLSLAVRTASLLPSARRADVRVNAL